CGVWEYEVESGQADSFVAAYGANGTWAGLFARADGFQGTRLFRDVDRANCFLNVDSWSDAACWDAFLERWGEDYSELAQQLQGRRGGGDLVIEGAVLNA